MNCWTYYRIVSLVVIAMTNAWSVVACDDENQKWTGVFALLWPSQLMFVFWGIAVQPTPLKPKQISTMMVKFATFDNARMHFDTEGQFIPFKVLDGKLCSTYVAFIDLGTMAWCLGNRSRPSISPRLRLCPFHFFIRPSLVFHCTFTAFLLRQGQRGNGVVVLHSCPIWDMHCLRWFAVLRNCLCLSCMFVWVYVSSPERLQMYVDAQGRSFSRLGFHSFSCNQNLEI